LAADWADIDRGLTKKRRTQWSRASSLRRRGVRRDSLAPAAPCRGRPKGAAGAFLAP
ncbi:unnamed protein product, partial [Amoebophrya sp. A120]